jgi:SAM-dependent methyltransferase
MREPGVSVRPQPVDLTRADFDRIARLPDGGWNHNDHYHAFLLSQLPGRCGEALEVGCGTGAFSRLLARRCDRVLALDLSPEMVRVASEASADVPNLSFQVADALTWDFPAGRFDAIASIATLHHLPLEPILRAMKQALRPGGTLLVLDLYQARSLADAVTIGMAVPVNAAMGLLRNGRLRKPPEVRAAWDAHWAHDVILPLSAIRSVSASVLPGARVRRHLYWRYSMVWKKPLSPD